MQFCVAPVVGVGAHDGSSQSAILGGGTLDRVGMDAEIGVDGTEVIAVVGSGRGLGVGVVVVVLSS